MKTTEGKREIREGRIRVVLRDFSKRVIGNRAYKRNTTMSPKGSTTVGEGGGISTGNKFPI